MPYRLKIPAILLAGFFSILGLGGESVYAAGAQEDLMASAREYVIEKKYDLALAQLAAVIRSDPKRLDEAQALISQIIQLKGGYNQYFQDLIATLTNDPGNYPRALELINKMSSVDPNPSSRTKQQIEDFRILAKIKKDRNDKDAIMAKALIEIQNKDYETAIGTYISGFGLQAEDFLIGTQADDFRKLVLSYVATVRNDVIVYKSENSNLMPSIALFTKEIEKGTEGLNQVVAALPAFSDKFLRTIRQTVRLEQSVAESAQLRARSEKEYPPSDKNYNYNEYLRFIQEFMSGPPGKTGQGIAFAARRLVDEEYADTLKRLDDLYAARKQAVALILSSNDSANSTNRSTAFASLYLAGNILLRAHGLKGNIDLGADPDFGDLNARLPIAFRRVPIAILMEVRAYSLLEEITKRRDALAGLRSSTAASVWRDTLVEYDTLIASVESWNQDIQAVQSAGFVDAPAVATARKVFSVPLNDVQTRLVSLARERFTGVLQGVLGAVSTPFLASAAEEKQANILLQGAPADLSAGRGAIYRFPDQALQIFSSLKQRYQDHLKSLDGLDTMVSVSRSELKDWPAVQTASSNSRSIQGDIVAALARIDGQIARSQTNIKKAQENIASANQAFAASETAIAGTKLEVDTAENLFAQATEQFFTAYDLAYNKDQRSVADTRLRDLRGRIDVARNILLTQQTRQLINGAAALFEQDEYQRALDSITQAESLDSQTISYRQLIAEGRTPVEAHNPEILYWKSRIQAASSFSNERSISEADPAFFSLSNYLNLAQVDYNEVVRLNAGGSKASARDLIERATKNLNNVLLVKPNNWDAKLLQIKLERIADVEAFTLRFPKRVADAIAQAKREPTTNSYNSLRALRELNPDVPGLQRAIENIEVALGIRLSPLTLANQEESRNLVVQARSLSRSTSQAELLRALGLSQRAITLNPGNREAGALSDAIRIRLRTAQDTLTFEEQQSLQNAQTLYNSGNAGTAYQIARDLRSRHPSYAPILKLIDQIERQLGINQ